MQISERLRSIKPSLTLSVNSRALELKAQGVEKIIFVTNGAKTAVKLSAIISKLTANGVFRLTHDGKAVTFTLGEKMANVSSILIKP